MKALTIKSPYIQRIMAGEKKLEIRTWKTSYRGPLLLTCSVSPACQGAGMALAIVDLVAIREMTENDTAKATIEYIPGAFAWEIANCREVKPFPVRGMPGIFKVEYHERR